jgi:AcrR family transcriptional regulator
MERTGRPRDPTIDGAVLDATADVLSQVGYARLTLEEVARRAGTTKPSIYRRWRSRPELVLAALAARLDAGAFRAPESGCVVCDLVAGVEVFMTAFRRVPPGVLGALFADCGGEPALREEFMSTLFEPVRRVAGEVVARAEERGDLRDGLDREVVVDLLGSFVHYRALYGHASTDASEVVVTLLRGMAADPTRFARRKHRHGLSLS